MQSGSKKSFFRKITPRLLDRVGPGRSNDKDPAAVDCLTDPGAGHAHRAAILSDPGSVSLYEVASRAIAKR